MNITELKQILEQNPDKGIDFILPDKTTIPAHFHITEVGHVRKDFIDCGGMRRAVSSCVLQAWVANDTDHGIKAGKLAAILKLAGKILPSDELEVEIEFEFPYLSQFPIESANAAGKLVVFTLTTKHTDCLAKEKCGVDDESESSCCSSESGCC